MKVWQVWGVLSDCLIMQHVAHNLPLHLHIAILHIFPYFLPPAWSFHLLTHSFVPSRHLMDSKIAYLPTCSAPALVPAQVHAAVLKGSRKTVVIKVWDV